MAVKSAFEELLETFSSDEDRKAFEELGAKNPKVKEFGMRQSDYSRRLDEVREDLSELTSWREWRKNNWEEGENMTKAEKAKVTQIEALEREKQELESRVGLGDDMTLEQLESWGQELIKKNGFVTEETLKLKETEYRDLVKGVNQFTAQAALNVPYLNQKHKDEFGELFDPEEFVNDAVKANRFDLKAFYEERVAPKRVEKMKSDFEQQKKTLTEDLDRQKTEAVKAAKDEAERARAMGAGGQNPSDIDSPTMGAMQRKILKMDQLEEGSKAPEVPLGEGGVAAFAAREWANKQASRANQ